MSLRLLDRSSSGSDPSPGSGSRSGDDAASVDPRIQARRDEVSREQLRRRRRRLGSVAAVVAVIALVFGATHSPMFDVDQVDITSTDHVSAEEVMVVGGLTVGEHLVDVDPAAVRSRLVGLPWVADADVELDWWGGTVKVVITERVPAAVVADGAGGWVAADATGRAVATLPPGIPGLAAVENVAPVELGSDFGPGILAPLQVLAELSPGLRSRVYAVVAGTDATLQLKVLPSGIVDLCQPERLTEKLAAATTWFADVDDAKLATLSVCIPDSPVATRLP